MPVRHYLQQIASNQKVEIKVHYSWQDGLHYPLTDAALVRADEEK